MSADVPASVAPVPWISAIGWPRSTWSAAACGRRRPSHPSGDRRRRRAVKSAAFVVGVGAGRRRGWPPLASLVGGAVPESVAPRAWSAVAAVADDVDRGRRLPGQVAGRQGRDAGAVSAEERPGRRRRLMLIDRRWPASGRRDGGADRAGAALLDDQAGLARAARSQPVSAKIARQAMRQRCERRAVLDRLVPRQRRSGQRSGCRARRSRCVVRGRRRCRRRRRPR